MEEPKKRKIDPESKTFNERWTKHYFFVEHDKKTTCLICKDTVTTFKENDVKRHYEEKHKKKYGDITGADRDEKIARLRREMEEKRKTSHTRKQDTDAAVRASYRVAHILSRDLKPFSDGECVKRCMMAVMEEMYPEKKSALKSVNLSTTTMTKRVEDMGKNIHEKLKRKAARFEMFSIAVDKWTDKNDNIQLLVFIRGINSSFEVTEELAGMRCLRGSATTDELFHEVSAIINEYGLPWKKLVGVTTNGTRCMIGCHNGLAARICRKVVEVKSAEPLQIHCIIHQQNICSKILRLDHVMKVVVNILNYMKTQAFDLNEFKELILDVESEYEDVLSGNEIPWLGRGKVVKRFFELRREIEVFMTERSRPVAQLKDPSWLWDLAILCDITTHVNELKIKLEGKGKLISHMYADVTAFQAKLQLFIHQAGKAILVHFPTCAALRQDEQFSSFFPKSRIIQLLMLLKDSFHERFLDCNNLKDGIRLFENPFAADVTHAPTELQLELIDLQSQSTLLDKFRSMKAAEFYSALPANSFPRLRKLALKLIAMFTSTHMCEEVFSMIRRANFTLQNRLTNEHLDSVLRIGVSSIHPDIEKLVSKQTSKQ